MRRSDPPQPAACMVRCGFLALSVLLAVGPLAGEAPVPRSTRSASYSLAARLEPATRQVDGRGTLHWTNPGDAPTDELWFHLYWNAYRNNQSTWMLEDGGRRKDDRGAPDGDWGFVELIELSTGGEDLFGSLRYASPDDGNPEDRTVAVATLTAPVQPGETIAVDFAWRSRVPRTVARTGFRGDHYFLAHWFPKLARYKGDAWSCHQFHAATEFAADFGSYDVALTVPRGWVVGATGREVERRDGDDDTTTHRYVEHDVHAFTWTTSPDYLVREARFEENGLPPVEMRLLLQPEHRDQEERHFAATRVALSAYGRWYGPYPYGHVTIVDPAFGTGFGGMEYPTLFTAGTRLFNPMGGGSPESVTIHEAGHQFWYGISANDEMEHAWLDEGLNTFSTARALDEAYGPRAHVERFFSPPGSRAGGFFALAYPEAPQSRAMFGNRLDRFRRVAGGEVQATPTYLYRPESSSRFSYDLTALWLATLERHLGWEVLQRGLSRFFRQAAFRHPQPAELFAALEAAAGEDLDWFFDQVHRSSVTFDYAIDSVDSRPVELRGLEVDRDGVARLVDPLSEKPSRFRTQVVVRRNGEGKFPVDVLLVFEDGHEIRQRWPGDYPTRTIVVEHSAKLHHAVVDPEQVLLLDLDWRNNYLAREPAGVRPAARWALRWMGWLQDYLTTVAAFLG